METGGLGAHGTGVLFRVEVGLKQAQDNVTIHQLCLVVNNVLVIMKDLKIAMTIVAQVILILRALMSKEY